MADERTGPLIQYEFTRSSSSEASGPVAGYELGVLHAPLPQGRHYLRFRVRGYADPGEGQEVVAGPWSAYSDPIYIPEAPTLPTLAALLIALGFWYRWKR